MRVMAALLCSALNACAFGPELTRVAVDQNELVANSNNRLLLLNILRARDREPLHFTSVQTLHGDASFTGSVGSTVTLNGATPTTERDATGAVTKVSTAATSDVVTPTIGLSADGKASMDINVWDSQDFYQGITASVPASTIAHYLHQGWPADLLTDLFVSSIDFLAEKAGDGLDKGELVASFINDPALRGNSFRAFVACYRLTSVPEVGSDTPLVPLSALSGKLTLGDLALLDGDKLDITAPADKNGKPLERWIKRKGHSGDSLGLRAVDETGAECSSGTSKIDLFNFVLTGPRTSSTPFRGRADEHSVVGTGSFSYRGKQIPVQVQVVLRSIDGVIYYLGEYLRAQPKAPRIMTETGLVPIINVVDSRPADVFVSARYKGVTYYAPATPGGRLSEISGRTPQVFALVEQLLNLQKSGKDRPSTQTVRVVQ